MCDKKRAFLYRKGTENTGENLKAPGAVWLSWLASDPRVMSVVAVAAHRLTDAIASLICRPKIRSQSLELLVWCPASLDLSTEACEFVGCWI